MMRCSSKTSRRGFILVLTLMLLSIAAVALAATARSSTDQAVAAVQARRDLQRDWANRSIRHTALTLAPSLLADERADTAESTPVRSITIQLNKHDYNIILTDEQAKVNINALLANRGREAARSFAVKQLADYPNSMGVYLPVTTDQTDEQQDHGKNELPRTIIGFNHLLPDFDPDELLKEQAAPFDALTCWGDGRINIKLAPETLLKEVASPLLGSIQIKRLHDITAENDDITLQQALTDIGVEEKNIPALLKRMTMDSRCFGVWIMMDDGRRDWCEFSVIELASNAEDKRVDVTGTNHEERLRAEAVDVNNIGDTSDFVQSSDAYPRLRVFEW